MENRIKRIEANYDSFLLTILNMVRGVNQQNDSRIDGLISQFDRLLSRIEPTENPITSDEIEKLKMYRNKIVHNLPFSGEEYLEFEELTKKMGSELPAKSRSEFDLVIAGLLGVALCLVLATLLIKNK